jgi:hypothetical protein
MAMLMPMAVTVIMRMAIRVQAPGIARSATRLQHLREAWREEVPVRPGMRMRVDAPPVPMSYR